VHRLTGTKATVSQPPRTHSTPTHIHQILIDVSFIALFILLYVNFHTGKYDMGSVHLWGLEVVNKSVCSISHRGQILHPISVNERRICSESRGTGPSRLWPEYKDCGAWSGRWRLQYVVHVSD